MNDFRVPITDHMEGREGSDLENGYSQLIFLYDYDPSLILVRKSMTITVY